MKFKEYFKLYPEGFRAEDVYVCESRYSAKSKSFKKIKMWTMPLSSVRFVPREVPLPVVRVASIFASKQDEKPPEIVDESNMTDVIIDKVKGEKKHHFFISVKNDGVYIPSSRKQICVCRKGRMSPWIWPMGSQGVSTMSSFVIIICGLKWEIVSTLGLMDWCATEWAGIVNVCLLSTQNSSFLINFIIYPIQ